MTFGKRKSGGWRVEGGGRRRPSTLHPPLSSLLLVCLLVCLLLAGCRGMSDPLDPFLGGTPARGPAVPQTSSAGGAQASQQTGVVPALPATHTMTSPAVLASGGSAPTGTVRSVSPSTGGVTLCEPSPYVSSTARIVPIAQPGGIPLPPGAGGPAIPESYESLQGVLAQHGVTRQRLETWGDGWKFSCSIPNRQDPNTLRHYEARAAGPNGTAAIRAVIDRIDQEQHGESAARPTTATPPAPPAAPPAPATTSALPTATPPAPPAPPAASGAPPPAPVAVSAVPAVPAGPASAPPAPPPAPLPMTH